MPRKAIFYLNLLSFVCLSVLFFVFSNLKNEFVGFEGFYGSQWLRARLCCRKISDSIFWLYYFYPTLIGRCKCLAQRRSIRNIQKEKIGTDRRRKHFFHTFLYLLGEWTNQRYVPKHSVVSKTPDSKIGVVGSTSLPEKRGRFTENLSIYLSSPAPNSPLQNPSNFGATASHWPLYILLFFFFLILTGWMCGALCVATRLYILYLAADESISGLGVFTVNS